MTIFPKSASYYVAMQKFDFREWCCFVPCCFVLFSGHGGLETTLYTTGRHFTTELGPQLRRMASEHGPNDVF